MRRFFRFPSLGKVFTGLAILGLTFLLFVLGAFAMYFELPLSESLRKAFIGLDAWQARGRMDPNPGQMSGADETQDAGASVDIPNSTFDGYTLYATTSKSRATLLDMRGNVVHQWSMPFSKAFPKSSCVQDPLDDDRVHWFRCRLFSNGDLLANYQADTDTPHGYGLVKLDKDSRLLWAYPGNAHHDFDVGSDGKIYTLTHEIASKKHAGIDYASPPFLDDFLVILSPDGKESEKISLLEAFRDSPFAITLSSIRSGAGASIRRRNPRRLVDPGETGDVLHANSVRVLSPALAPKFPLFKEGQVLLSLRAIDTIAVLDIPTRSIIWSVQGIWRAQHDPGFLENGHLLLYDNAGSDRGARVLEFDPSTHVYPWSYSSENSRNFFAKARGMNQRLPNGNTLIVDPVNARFFEVNMAKELVWQFRIGLDSPEETRPFEVTSAIRYAADELTFLKGGTGVRP